MNPTETQAETQLYAVRQRPGGAWVLICPQCAIATRGWGDEVKKVRIDKDAVIRCAICRREHYAKDVTGTA